VVGNAGQANRLYLNNGTADPFNSVSGVDITGDTHPTTSMAMGDVDVDGDLDLVAGNSGQANRLYLNNGTADPFNGVSGVDITSDAHDTRSMELGDVDGDGDLDLVAGNYGQANRLYLNNSTADPYNGVSGGDITGDTHDTVSVALGDVDGDGHLDLVVGNDGDGHLDLVVGNYISQQNRLYLNNGTADPFNSVSGVDITSDDHNTYSVALGDVDRDGDLDLVAGNLGQANRLYLNNGTADPYNGVSGIDIACDVRNTRSVALGDVDGDGHLDLVAGNDGQANRLYRRRLYHTGQGQAGSLRVDSETEDIAGAVLTATVTLPQNTSITYYLSNNGGVDQVRIAKVQRIYLPVVLR